MLGVPRLMDDIPVGRHNHLTTQERQTDHSRPLFVPFRHGG